MKTITIEVSSTELALLIQAIRTVLQMSILLYDTPEKLASVADVLAEYQVLQAKLEAQR